MAEHPTTMQHAATRRRVTLLIVAAVLASIDMAAKALAEARLADTVVDFRLAQLRLSYNTGIAFGLGSAAPGWIVNGVIRIITARMHGRKRRDNGHRDEWVCPQPRA